MARILFTVWPFAGHLHPTIAVGHALRARGHQVGFCTGESVRALVEGEGFHFFPFEKVDEKRISELASSEFPYTPSLWQRLKTAPKQGSKFREWLVDTIPQQVQDVDRVITEWRPTFWLAICRFGVPS